MVLVRSYYGLWMVESEHLHVDVMTIGGAGMVVVVSERSGLWSLAPMCHQ